MIVWLYNQSTSFPIILLRLPSESSSVFLSNTERRNVWVRTLRKIKVVGEEMGGVRRRRERDGGHKYIEGVEIDKNKVTFFLVTQWFYQNVITS
jgi:hypothetical protein